MQEGAELRGYLPQDQITRRVSMPVVDSLEVIEVAQDDAQLLLRFAGALHRSLRLADEVLPIADPGQTVDARQGHEMQLGALGPVGPQSNKDEDRDEQRRIQTAGFQRLRAQLLLQPQHLVL